MIKKLVLLYATVQTLLLMPGLCPTAKAADNNLISNPSAEIVGTDPTMPQDWLTNKYGTNDAVFEYAADGQDFGRSLKVTLSAYTSGDAKWYFKPVTVEPNVKYDFSDYYKSSVGSSVDVQFTSTTGVVSYKWLGDLPASASWAPANFSFTTPADTSLLTIFHSISQIGYLQTDNFFLGKAASAVVVDNVPNNSLEQSANGQPIDWTVDKYGINDATFEYKNDGEDGTHSALVTMASHTSGDAKWYFTSASIEPGVGYTFSDYYKSSVPTSVDAQITSTSGVVSYKWLGDLPASTDWTKSSLNMMMPADAAKATIFHSIAQIGFLQTDNFSLKKVDTRAVTGIIPNSSLEDSSNSKPLSWTSETWQNNTPVFSYLNEGHTGAHSISVDVSSYTSGDSKWYFTPQPIKPGQYYEFSDWYKSNIDTEIDAEIRLTDGSYLYPTLGKVGPSATWAQFKGWFTAPSNAETITFFHIIAGVGYLTTDDYSLTEQSSTSQNFNRGIISLTFDDADKSDYTAALPAMQKYNMPGTLYLVTDYLNTPAHVSTDQVKEMQQAGFEVGSHTIDHPHLTTLSDAQDTNELATSKQLLESAFGPVSTFASPFGEYDSRTLGLIGQNYASQRTTDSGYNTKDNFDPSIIRAETVRTDTPLSQVQDWINGAVQDKTWLVFTFHLVDSSGDLYSVTPTVFGQIMDMVHASSLPVETVSQAIAEIVPQLK